MKRSRTAVRILLALAVAGVAVTVTTGATAHKLANIQVCVLLPDTKSSVRWVQFDAPDFAKGLKAAHLTYSITNALNDPQKMVSQADSCLSRHAKIAVVTDIAQGTSIAIENKFKAAGGQSIDYDRQVVGGIAKVYVSFDGKAVGAAQARGVINGLKKAGKYGAGKKPVMAELWGGPTDQNAFWFKSGNDAVLNPLFKSGKLTKGPQQFVPLWLATNAQPIFEQMLLKTNNKIDGAIAANDNIAGAVVAELWGGPTDQNAFWFKSGNDAVLNPLFKKGTLTKGPQQFVPLWLATNAQPIFEQMLLKTNNKIDGAIAANDNIAGAVVASLKAHHLKPIALSGQDATVQGVQNIISGWQTMTVYKYVPTEVNATVKAIKAMLKHKKIPGINGFRKNGTKKEPTVQLPVVSITKANYTRLFKDKFLKKSDVCVGEFAQFCK